MLRLVVRLGLFVAQGTRLGQTPDVDAVVEAFCWFPELVNWKREVVLREREREGGREGFGGSVIYLSCR